MSARCSVFWAVVAVTLITLVGCGNDAAAPPVVPGPEASPPPVNTPPFVHTAPSLAVASPSALAVGDMMTILGDDFIEPIHGKALVHFTGSFIDDQGQASPVDYRAEAIFVNNAKIQWSLWPNIVFAPTGDRLGRFVGAVAVVNQARDGSEKVSAQLPMAVDIKPSLVPRVIQPRGQGCQAIVARARENAPMVLSVEAVGLRPGTADNPLVYSWTFLNQQWQVSFNNGLLDPSSIFPDRDGAVLVEQRVTDGLTSTVADGGNSNFFVKVKNELFGQQRLSKLRTRAIESQEGTSAPITVAISAEDGSGKRAKIALRLEVGKVVDMHYDGATVLAERFPPVQVTDCIPGGDIGRDVNYHETSSESRHRAMTHSYNASLGLRLGLPSNPLALGMDFSAGFGVNVNEGVSTDRSESLSMQAHILPGQYGVFYRQTSKILRVAQLVGYSACGEPMTLGEITLTDWVFSPHMATGDVCVPPPTELPPAQKFVYDDE